MDYLVLNFEDAGLILRSKNIANNKNFVRTEMGGSGKLIETGGHDLETPIPYTLLSNVLHVLCGKRPVPTKQFSLFKRQEKFDKIAKNSYVHYNFKPLDENGYVPFREKFRTGKSAFNSHMQCSTTFHTCQGDKTYKGYYTNSYLYQTFKNKKDYKLFCEFLSELVGKDFHSFNLSDYIMEVSKKWGTKSFNEKFDKFLTENPSIEKELKMWIDIFRGEQKSKNSNTNFYSRTPLLYTKGINEIVKINGQILCPIDDEQILDDIRKNGGSARLLEGGLVYIDSLKNEEEIGDLSDYWEKIFEENSLQTTDSKEII